jgi:hypothetical protein
LLLKQHTIKIIKKSAGGEFRGIKNNPTKVPPSFLPLHQTRLNLRPQLVTSSRTATGHLPRTTHLWEGQILGEDLRGPSAPAKLHPKIIIAHNQGQIVSMKIWYRPEMVDQ